MNLFPIKQNNFVKTVFCFLLLLHVFPVSSQIRLEGYGKSKIDNRLYSGRWSAFWISAPESTDNSYGVYHFRKEFTLSEVPGEFIVHASADGRYKLYVNGELVSLGPACGDVLNWSFETVDLAPLLKTGKNIIAAVVWNFADKKPLAQISFGKTAFLLQGNTATEEAVNTNSSWSGFRNNAYSPHEKPVLGYYAAGACEKVEMSKYPWGWEESEYDDSHWMPAVNRINAAMKGATDYPGWQLVPRPIPPMEMVTVRIKSVREAKNTSAPAGFPQSRKPLTINANTEAELLLDNQILTTGYLNLLYSGGKDAVITLGYTEALYEDPASITKGNRNEIKGKQFVGYQDMIVSDGGADRAFTPLWWRTWRYIKVHIKTSAEPLTIDDIYATTSMYPFERESKFRAEERPELDRILETGWRTARLCANETYMDCPYYEQLQYFGDTRIQSMITMFNTRDDRLVRNALEQGRQSIVPDGITMSRYPSELHQFIPSFSLWWICMGHDYWMYRGEEEYVKTLLPAYRGVLSWFEQYLKPDYTLERIPFWFFADWSGTPSGEPIREDDGNSAFQDLLYMIALQSAAEMETAFGSKVSGEYYAELAGTIGKTIRQKYWNAERKLFADTFGQHSFSQHVNVLAILCDIVQGHEASELMYRVLDDKTIMQCTIYFRYYLQQAMKRTGNGNLLLDNLQIWQDQLALGLSTWAEQPEPSRSDCHAWGSSPNIEFFRIVLGIDSDAPGFGRVKIEPALGKLKKVSGSIPHPLGEISVSYNVTKKGKITADIEIPQGVSGVFVWEGKEYLLAGGSTSITAQ